MTALIAQARRDFHAELVDRHTLSISGGGVASNADGSQSTSIAIARNIADNLGAKVTAEKLKGQRAGKQFEEAVEKFIASTFLHLDSIRPGSWMVENVGGCRKEYQLARYEPYSHLAALAKAIESDPTLESVLGNSYTVSPDVLVVRKPEPDEVINKYRSVVDSHTAKHAVIRAANQDRALVHAVVSCKWTLRSDRAQNSRSEALNVIRNRKGRTPHVAVVTGEPSPSRISSLALGTGDIDMVYHFALPELIKSAMKAENDEASNMLEMLVSGQRLRDISDLPLDLAV